MARRRKGHSALPLGDQGLRNAELVREALLFQTLVKPQFAYLFCPIHEAPRPPYRVCGRYWNSFRSEISSACYTLLKRHVSLRFAPCIWQVDWHLACL